jgi:Transposase family tnp2
MYDVKHEFADIPEMFENLGKEMSILLYLGRKLINIITIFKLYNLKAKNGWSDKSFTSLLELLKEILPKNNEISDSMYKVKKILCPLMMEAERIPVCPNDYMLFRVVHKDLKKYLKYNASRYKQKSDEIESTKGANAKVIWYLPILPRLQRLFSNPKDVKLLLWHVECRKEDGMLRHPADSPEWTSIDIKHGDFVSDPRNLRI